MPAEGLDAMPTTDEPSPADAASAGASHRVTPAPPNVVVVVTGAGAIAPDVVAGVVALAPDVVVAADGGLDWARASGLRPDVLIGDLDSVSAPGLAWADQHGTVIRHPADKTATDTELAVAYAAALGPRRLVLVAGPGDRLDHTIAAVGALGSATADTADTRDTGTPGVTHGTSDTSDPAGAVDIDVVEAWWGDDRLLVATPRRRVTLDEPPGTTFSVLAMHGQATGVSITGARWPLSGATLGPVTGQGVSNAVVDGLVTVTVDDGTLTIIIPGAQP